MGVFPSPLTAWGVGHIDAQEQFPEVFAVLEPEKGGALEPKATPRPIRPRPSGLLGTARPRTLASPGENKQ